MQVLKDIFTIRRPEFMIVEATIFSMPILVVAHGMQALTTGLVIEGLLLFFVLYSFGDMINCLADRDLDSTYKTRLSRAVYRLGVGFVRKILIVELVAALLLGIHLAWSSGRWQLLALVLAGVFLGVEYSVGPFYFKSRGIGHLLCLWLLLYFLPMLFAALLVVPNLSAVVVILAMSYATIEMGIILINTSEDLPEDRAMGVCTTTVFLGLRRTLRLSAMMVLIGGILLISVWIYLFWNGGISNWGYAALLLLTVVCIYVFLTIVTLSRRVELSEEPVAVKLVKAQGAKVPIWATLVGWMSVLCGVAYFIGRQ